MGGRGGTYVLLSGRVGQPHSRLPGVGWLKPAMGPISTAMVGLIRHVGVARGGVEPPTFHFSGERYYQLSYLALATPTGLEPATSAVTGRRANQLRYGARSRCLVQATRKL